MFYVHTVRLEEHIRRMQEESKRLHMLAETIARARGMASGTEQQQLRQMENSLKGMINTVRRMSEALQGLYEKMMLYETQTLAQMQELQQHVKKLF